MEYYETESWSALIFCPLVHHFMYLCIMHLKVILFWNYLDNSLMPHIYYGLALIGSYSYTYLLITSVEERDYQTYVTDVPLVSDSQLTMLTSSYQHVGEHRHRAEVSDSPLIVLMSSYWDVGEHRHRAEVSDSPLIVLKSTYWDVGSTGTGPRSQIVHSSC